MNQLRHIHDLWLISQITPKNPPQSTPNHFDPLDEYDDENFRGRYRMSKNSFRKLVTIIWPQEEIRSGRKGYSKEIKLLVTLRFLASGSFQQVTGDTIGIWQSTGNRIINQVAKKIAQLSPQFISTPDRTNLPQIKKGFFDIIPDRYPSAKPFPGVIGAIDCTHVKITATGVPNREVYRDRKNNLSLNIQAVCDHRLLFWNVVCRWQGSVHDSRIFANSELKGYFEENPNLGYLVGDSGYPLRRYLLTPISNPVTRAERGYNFSHAQVRNCIERAFGVLKQRFAVLKGTIKQDMAHVVTTIMACFVLHNFLILEKDEVQMDEPSEDTPMEVDSNECTPNEFASTSSEITDSKVARRIFIENHFN